jgi:anti-anti-sigma regulatory factor
MFWREQGKEDEVLVRFSGILDAATARGVRRYLGIDLPKKVVLDFSQSANVDYYGLSVLVSEIAACGRAVLLRGLDVGHVRMLRYFGLDPGQFGLSDRTSLDVA